MLLNLSNFTRLIFFFPEDFNSLFVDKVSGVLVSTRDGRGGQGKSAENSV